MSDDTIRLSVRLPQKLHQAAKDQGGPIAETIRVALEQHLKVYRDSSLIPVACSNILPATYKRAQQLLKGGGYIQVIKFVREAQGLGLKEAKAVVDTIRDELRAAKFIEG